MTRRRLLPTGGAGATAGLAGCGGSGGSDEPGDVAPGATDCSTADPDGGVTTIDFGGETVDVYSTPGYPQEVDFHVFWLPHGSAPDYYRVKLLFGSTLLAETDGTLEMLCLDAARAETERVVASVRPNPATTIDA